MTRAIQDIPTKELLRMRDASYVHPGLKVVSVGRGGRGESMAYRQAYREEEGFTRAEILAELATREHIPNKQEARAIRQALAKGGR